MEEKVEPRFRVRPRRDKHPEDPGLHTKLADEAYKDVKAKLEKSIRIENLRNLRKYNDDRSINLKLDEDIEEKRWALKHIMGYKTLNSAFGRRPIDKAADFTVSAAYKNDYEQACRLE